jgi:hypothetical protein
VDAALYMGYDGIELRLLGTACQYSDLAHKHSCKGFYWQLAPQQVDRISLYYCLKLSIPRQATISYHIRVLRIISNM